MTVLIVTSLEPAWRRPGVSRARPRARKARPKISYRLPCRSLMATRAARDPRSSGSATRDLRRLFYLCAWLVLLCFCCFSFCSRDLRRVRPRALSCRGADAAPLRRLEGNGGRPPRGTRKGRSRPFVREQVQGGKLPGSEDDV